MNRFIYVFKINFGIEDTFYTAHIPNSLCILLDRTLPNLPAFQWL